MKQRHQILYKYNPCILITLANPYCAVLYIDFKLHKCSVMPIVSFKIPCSASTLVTHAVVTTMFKIQNWFARGHNPSDWWWSAYAQNKLCGYRTIHWAESATRSHSCIVPFTHQMVTLYYRCLRCYTDYGSNKLSWNASKDIQLPNQAFLKSNMATHTTLISYPSTGGWAHLPALTTSTVSKWFH